jgi:HEPN domain-containing protein
MNKISVVVFALLLFAACKENKKTLSRIPVAEVDNTTLYYDEIPQLIQKGVNEADSTAIIHNYINKWAKRQLLLQKAEENLSAQMKTDIASQLEETRTNLFIYQYQRQIMLEKMDTVISDQELDKYYTTNEKSFLLNENIVKALFIKLPQETPDLEKIKRLARSNKQSDLQQLESSCFQFAEKFDDFNEKWIPMSRLSVELQQDIGNEENFLRKYTFFETSDASSVYLIAIRDYRLRSTLAPYEYVKDDIKRIIWNTRRVEFIQSLENGIYNEALKKNSFKIY